MEKSIWTKTYRNDIDKRELY